MQSSYNASIEESSAIGCKQIVNAQWASRINSFLESMFLFIHTMKQICKLFSSYWNSKVKRKIIKTKNIFTYVHICIYKKGNQWASTSSAKQFEQLQINLNNKIFHFNLRKKI